MRSAHVAPSYHPFLGGAESHLKALSEGRARRGHEVLVVTQQRAIGLAGDRALRTFRPDVVGVVNWYFGGMVAALAIGPRPGFARVGIPHFHSEEAWSRRPGYQALIRRDDALLVNTEHERRLIAASGRDRRRVRRSRGGIAGRRRVRRRAARPRRSS